MLGKAIMAVASIIIMCALAGTCIAQGQFLRKENAPGIVVFIHGLTGDSKETWRNGPDGIYWPQLIKDDRLFDGMDILVYDYPSSYYRQGFTIQGLADQISTTFRDSDINIASYERIVIIAHSLGGIVARKYILDNRDIQHKIKGLFLFATPMNGSSLANFFASFSGNPVVKQLQKPSSPDDFLNTLRKEWINASLSLSIPTGCAYENIGSGYPLFKQKVVERDSAERLCNIGLVEINQDHIGIVKPAPPDYYVHKVLKQWYAEIFPDAERSALDEEATFPVLIASCAVDRYGRDLTGAMSREIAALGYTSRLSRRLPEDWQPSYKSLLWQKHEPKLLIIHLSCFQQGLGSTETYVERTADFIKFLDTLSDSRVKILVYSGAFQHDPSFLSNHVPPLLLKTYRKDGRLEHFALKHGQSFASDSAHLKKFKYLAEKMLHYDKSPE